MARSSGSGTSSAAPKGAGSAGAGSAGAGSGAPSGVKRFRNVWVLPIVRGILLVIFGLLLSIQPIAREFDTVRWVIGAFLVVDGVVAAAQGFAHKAQRGWHVWLWQTVVDVVFGLVVMFWPNLSVTALYYVLASWAVALGVTLLVTSAILTRARDLESPWILTVGIVAVLYGVLLVLRPADGSAESVLSTLTLVFSFLAFVLGAIFIVTGFATRATAAEIGALRERSGSGSTTAAGFAGSGAAGAASADAWEGSVLGGSPLPESVLRAQEQEKQARKDQEARQREQEKQAAKAQKEAEKQAEKERKEREKAAAQAEKEREKAASRSDKTPEPPLSGRSTSATRRDTPSESSTQRDGAGPGTETGGLLSGGAGAGPTEGRSSSETGTTTPTDPVSGETSSTTRRDTPQQLPAQRQGGAGDKGGEGDAGGEGTTSGTKG